eukprot:2800628-Pyramimonas_sp.AAC.1
MRSTIAKWWRDMPQVNGPAADRQHARIQSHHCREKRAHHRRRPRARAQTCQAVVSSGEQPEAPCQTKASVQA